MATVILTAVGTALGGPIGGALGAMAGQAIDQRLFRGKGREGPRLTDLAVQSSSYGTPIPKIFGTMRVAGTVIWSTELIEHVARDGGVKGRAGSTRYSYSASFAVALSARPILSVGRIWADGKLLRGAAGDFKSATRFRLHRGGEAQAVDPLIASAEGMGSTPAFRGVAYAVFEDLALEDFGNRIPSLTLEVTADAAPVDCADILHVMSGGVIAGATGTTLSGYSGYGDTIRGPSDAILQVSGAWLRGDCARLEARSGPGSSVTIRDGGAGRGARRARSFAAADSAPRAIALQHHDPARDYQVGLQRVRRASAGARELAIELPAAIDAGAAKGLAAAALSRIDVERERRTVSLDWRSLALVPGDRVTIDGEPGLWRVVEATLEAMVLTVELIRVVRRPVAAQATSGTVAAAPDTIVGPTLIHAFEIPPFDHTVLTSPRLMVAAAGIGPGWRSAALQLSLDGGTSWVARGATAGPATLGLVVAPPGQGASTLEDRHGAVEVVLAHAGMTLADADGVALAQGANLALVGDELLQFGSAKRIDATRWRLTTLWRGRRGTEWAIGRTAAGDRFVLIEPESLVTLELPVSTIGTDVTVMASGVGDAGAAVTATVRVEGDSVAPPSPVHLAIQHDADAARLTWTRRSRAGWHWADGIDAPLAEEGEMYLVAYGDAAIGAQIAVLPEISVPGDAIAVEVRQIGTAARSRPTRRLL
ncbi:phage tail protein [uncultured Sphingomonas sp.]|uniref:GTA baseplate fiber-binding domain-containing protein n=1 Tax=uncultured Sphingomonas sp. TaxID=158754 RepID=UPI00374A627D